MKNALLLFALLLGITFANAQCTPYTQTTAVFYPASSDVPCVAPGQPFSQTYTMLIPSSISGGTVNSFTITNIVGLPAGLTATYTNYPPTYSGGSRFCFLVSGTTNAACGQYLMKIYVNVNVSVFGVPTNFSGSLDSIARIVNLTGFTPPPSLRVYQSVINCPVIDPSQTALFVAYSNCGVSNPPSLSTNVASGISANSATLNGSVNPNGANVSLEFEWGTSTAYGSTAIANPSNASGSNMVNVSGTLNGLSAGTTYHYRIKGTPSGGTSAYGNDRMFSTLTTGINDISLGGMNLYPNPSKGAFTLEMATSKSLSGTVCLINQLGAECVNQQITAGKNVILTGNLASGLYVVKVQTAEGTYARQIMIEN